MTDNTETPDLADQLAKMFINSRDEAWSSNRCILAAQAFQTRVDSGDFGSVSSPEGGPQTPTRVFTDPHGGAMRYTVLPDDTVMIDAVPQESSITLRELERYAADGHLTEHVSPASLPVAPNLGAGDSEVPELATLPPEVRRLVHAVDRMRDSWNNPDGKWTNDELWRHLHLCNDAVWGRGEYAGSVGGDSPTPSVRQVAPSLGVGDGSDPEWVTTAFLMGALKESVTRESARNAAHAMRVAGLLADPVGGGDSTAPETAVVYSAIRHLYQTGLPHSVKRVLCWRLQEMAGPIPATYMGEVAKTLHVDVLTIPRAPAYVSEEHVGAASSGSVVPTDSPRDPATFVDGDGTVWSNDGDDVYTALDGTMSGWSLAEIKEQFGTRGVASSSDREVATPKTAKCICPKFVDTGGFGIADLCCPVHGVDGTNPGDGFSYDEADPPAAVQPGEDTTP
jgi:hypothetical protein